MTPEFDPKLSVLSILTTAIVLLGTIPSCFCENHETCNRTIECGDTRDIRYPFWGEERHESCGYPGFELTCGDRNTLLLNISSLSYRVLNIDYDNHRLLVSREDLTNNFCQPSLLNTTLDLSIFNFSPIDGYRNITLFYRCRLDRPRETFPYVYDFSCGGNNFYTTTESIVNTNTLSCETIITVPVNQTAAMRLEDTATATRRILEETIGDGFWIEWYADDISCDNCTMWGGLCGRDLDSNSFVCHDAPPRDNQNLGLIIGLSIAGAVIAGALMWLLLYLRQRRKKRNLHLGSQLPQTTSKEITSNSLSTPGFNRYTPSFTTSNSSLGQESSYFGVQVFNYSELQEATDNFHPSQILGDGGFGTVYYGTLSDGRIVAVKRLYESNFKRVEQFMNEVQILTRLRHENLVKLYGCTSKRSHELLLVYEYIPNGTVSDHLHGQNPGPGFLPWPVRLNIAIETAEALNYLHKSDIIHRDVKTNNILLDGDFHVKVADFGLSRLFPTDVTHVTTAPQGTPGYVDPEYYQCYQLNEKSDVYSFGVVLVELISSLPAVDTSRHRHDINLANMAVNKIHNRALEELVDSGIGFGTDFGVRKMVMAVAELAFRCLLQVGEMRPSMEEVLGGLKGIREEGLNGEAEVLSVGGDDEASLLKGGVGPPSPESAVTDKWVSGSAPNSSG